ncbi:hypothetical protein ASZ78_010479 [Callipepla squamata]|uniref:Exportin-1/Importin-beta-like domain-containing protein n=1 Tax=Callipepla squamata TaxID=9009 RepID=A0A226M9L6_CALSU|nr:hypothetical protein ASZ78_010479 [Callipepla squamata]
MLHTLLFVRPSTSIGEELHGVCQEEKVYLGKLNVILVQILKQEWPKHWPVFRSDIVGASRTSESLCQNNTVILKLVSEEVFDFSSGHITQVQAKRLKDRQVSLFNMSLSPSAYFVLAVR